MKINAQILEELGRSSVGSESSGDSEFYFDSFEPLDPPPSKPDPFPTDHLGELAGVVALVSEHVHCPIALAAQSTLAAVSVSTQHLVDIRSPLVDQVTPVSCFFLSVAPSGERKSTADGFCIAPVREHERERYEAFRHELAAYENQKLVYDHERRESLHSEDAGLELASLPIPEKPVNPMILMPEPTLEAIEKHGGPSIGIFSDEGGRLFGGYAMSQDNRVKTICGLSGLWDGMPIKRIRASEDPFIRYDSRASLHLMFQPRIADAVLGDRLFRDQGFLPRCLIACPESIMGTRIIDKPHAPLDEYSCYQEYRARLLELLRDQSDRVVMECDSEAGSLLIEYHNHIERQIGAEGSLHSVSGFAARSAAHALRLAAILAGYERFPMVTGRHMNCGIELAQFYLSEAQRLIGCTGESQEMVNARLILDWLSRHRIEIFHTKQILQLGPNALRHDKKGRDAGIKVLVDHGYLKQETQVYLDGATRKNAWRINGRIHEI